MHASAPTSARSALLVSRTSCTTSARTAEADSGRAHSDRRPRGVSRPGWLTTLRVPAADTPRTPWPRSRRSRRRCGRFRRTTADDVRRHSRTRNARRITSPASDVTSTRATKRPARRAAGRNSSTPRVLGRTSRDAARTRATRRAPRNSERRARERENDSLTLPRFSTVSWRCRRSPPVTRSPRATSRLTIVPGARTTTTTPIRTRTARPPRTRRRVVKRTSASWSPGSAPRGTRDAIVTVPEAPGFKARLRGRNLSHPDAERPPLRGATTRGRPRRSSANPARTTSRATGLEPEFVMRTGVLPVPAIATCAGVAVSATGARVVLASAEADASTSRDRNTRTSVRDSSPIIDR